MESLIHYGQKHENTTPKRSDRAWELAEDLANSHGLELKDAIRQIEYEDGMNRSED